ncbi:MAG: hypothetical protein ACO3NR_01820 [Rhodothermales bacterium]
MNMKLYTTGIVAALVISSSGVIAYEHELFGGPSPVHADSMLTAYPAEVPGPQLTPIEEALKDPRHFDALIPEQIDSETLWLARAIFSETKRPDEQALVAWVIRNRVDTRYRGRSSYQGVVLDPWQFSAFLPGSEKAAHYTGLTPYSRVPGWQMALRIAYTVRFADPRHRPFSKNTRHFYSQRSMTGTGMPMWATGMAPVDIGYHSVEIDPERFRFFEDIS